MKFTRDNTLIHALANNELEKFLVGEAPYFFEAKKDNEEPQNVNQAFDLLVFPYWKQTKDVDFPAKFVSALLVLLSMHADRNKAIYVAHDWIWHYRYCLNKKRMQPTGYYGDLFEVDLSQVAALLKDLIETNKNKLINDKRWAGAPWNSKNGMWEPLLRISETVRDKLGGPDFVPTNV